MGHPDRAHHRTCTRPLVAILASAVTSGNPSATAVPAMSRSNGSRNVGSALASETCLRSSGIKTRPGARSTRSHQASKGTPSLRAPLSSSCAISNRHTVGTTNRPRPASTWAHARAALRPKDRTAPATHATRGAVSRTPRRSVTPLAGGGPAPRSQIERVGGLAAQSANRAVQILKGTSQRERSPQGAKGVICPLTRVRIRSCFGDDLGNRPPTAGQRNPFPGSPHLISQAPQRAPCFYNRHRLCHVYT